MSTASSVQSSVADGDGGGEFMLFGVRVNVDPMRKCVSLNNLSQYVPQEFLNVRTEAAGYVSADDVVHRLSLPVSRDRKRGVPWTEDEHKLFLLGLQKAGKGDWRGISKNFVKTRTPTQVASHAQKYFLRQTNLNRRRRRTSLFDITTDSVTPTPMEEKAHKAQPVLPPPQLSRPENSFLSGAQVFHFPLPGKIDSQVEKSASAPVIPVLPKPAQTRMLDLNLNQEPSEDPSPWSLDLSLSLDQGQGQKHFSTNSAFEVMPSFSHGDSMISVA